MPRSSTKIVKRIPYSYAERVAYAKHRSTVQKLLRDARKNRVELLPMSARNSVR